MKLSEGGSVDPIRGLFYGVSGSGKTSLLALLAKYESTRPVYFFDWDLRIQSIRASLPEEYWQYIESDPYRDKNIGGEAFILMQAKLEKLEKEGFKSVVIDSYTFAMSGMMARVLQLDKGQPITTTPQLQHYMQQMSLAEDTVRKACAKNFNFFITCHEDTSKDELTGRLFKTVDLTGKMANRIPGYFNEFWHCEVSQVTSAVIGGPTQEYKVRTRSDHTFGARTSYRDLSTVESQSTIWDKVMTARSKLSKEQMGVVELV